MDHKKNGDLVKRAKPSTLKRFIKTANPILNENEFFIFFPMQP